MTMRIHLVDSHTYSMVFGWYLCECARKLRNGGDLRSCILELESKLAGWKSAWRPSASSS